MPAAALPLPSRLAVAVGALLAVAGAAPAADLPVRITSARVGFPVVPREGVTNPGDSVCKFGAWAPVYADLEIVAAVAEPAELVVETPDADGVMTSLAVPIDLTDAKPGQTVRAHDRGGMAYARPAGGTAETTITVRARNGKAPLSEPYRIRNLHTRDDLSYVFLGLGSPLPGFDLPIPGGGNPNAPPGPLRNGRVELTAITDVDDLPQKWVGYDGADLVVLPTADAAFVNQLLAGGGPGQRPSPVDALREWVRRGGRLVVSVGAYTRPRATPAGLLGTFPIGLRTDAPTRAVNQLPVLWTARETSQAAVQSGVLRSATPFPVANLALPGRGRVVSPPPSRQGEGTEPVAVQVAYGLGKVTVVAFDLDRPPFAPDPAKPGDKGFAGRAEFWDWVLREGGAARASVGNETRPPPSTASGPTGDEDEVTAALRTHLDTFAGVPVVSFGGVAALIALYGLLVAPVEYLFLRRVLRRPGWTWITLPVIVLTVAVAAYLTAARAKGTDLRVNKVDVVDVLPADRRDDARVYGTTWLTAFAPRSEALNVSLVPSERWVMRGSGMVGWSGGPRGGRGGLLRRRYEYADGGDGRDATRAVDGVPVSTWATKGFAGTWEGHYPETLVESRLEHPPGDPTKAVGTFVNKLPVPELTDCVAFYAGQAFPLGTILSGQEVRLVLDRGPAATQWLQENARLADLLGRAAGRSGAGGGLPLWGLLFHEAALRNDEGVIPRNASVRRLDQSWRLAPDNRDEVIVVGRALPPPGPAADLFDGPASPSRFWLHATPGRGHEQPPPVPGVGRQETYVRLYLPVKSATP
ncbi:MAG: hypothetical protein K2X82_03060 [Gemmataceae bacterium]|nr:hypothetical protein [Gemmataceae bacterium]